MGTSRRRNSADSVREQIKLYILEHELRPNSLMPSELELCDALGVGRSSVREAVRQLDALDILRVEHGRGTFVGDLSLAPLVDSVSFRTQLDEGQANAALREIVEVREALDLGQSHAVVAALAGGFHQSLHDLVNAMIDKTAHGEAIQREDRAFHTGLQEFSTQNRLLANLMGAFWDIHTAVLAKNEVPTPKDLDDTVRAHGAMLGAAESGDEDRYREAVKDHYRPLIRILNRSSADAPDDAIEVS